MPKLNAVYPANGPIDGGTVLRLEGQRLGDDASRRAALDCFERIDDVIMGGVSSSRLVLDDAGASFEGRLREEGGGFCGQRLKLLAEPLDLSSTTGLFLDCDGRGTATASRGKGRLRVRLPYTSGVQTRVDHDSSTSVEARPIEFVSSKNERNRP